MLEFLSICTVGLLIFLVVDVLMRIREGKWSWSPIGGIIAIIFYFSLIGVLQSKWQGQPKAELPSIGIHQIVAFSGDNYLVVDNDKPPVYYRIKSPLVIKTSVNAGDGRMNTMVISRDENLGLKEIEIFLLKTAIE